MHSMLDVTICSVFFPNGLAAHVYEKSEVTAKGFGGRGRVGSIWFNVKWSYYGLPCFAKF